MRKLALAITGLALFLSACGPVTPVIPTATLTAVPPSATVDLAAAASQTAVIPAAQTAAAQTLAAPTLSAAATATARASITPSPTVSAEQVCPASETVCVLDGHFLLHRPIGPGGNRSIERSYVYGSTQEGKREPHHGVEFANPQGTPVLAAADGRVVFAGRDDTFILAGYPDFYGNVVVVSHALPGMGQVVYTLYAHLSAIEVQAGQDVSAGRRLGQVGSTGTAIGSHLHFEVRMGSDTYASNRNPVLWLLPSAGTGVLAGRIEDRQGVLQAGVVNVQRLDNGQLNPVSVASLESYGTTENIPVGRDNGLQEDLVAGDLPVGTYRLTLVFRSTIYEQVVNIEDGRLTFFRFIVRK